MRFRSSQLVLLLLAGCSSGGSGSGPPAPVKPTWAFEKTFNAGSPVTLTLRLDRTEADLSDRLVLEQELHIDPGFESDFPEYLPEDFEGFSVVEIQGDSAHTQTPRAQGAAESGETSGARTATTPPGPLVRRKQLTLEPDRSGSLAIAELAVYFHPAGKMEEQFFLTEEIKVDVKAPESLTGLTIEPSRGIFESPPSVGRSSLWPVLAAAAGVVVVVAGAYFVVSRRKVALRPSPPPHELAYDALRRLVALGLVEKGQIELFFVHLTGILRDYIERRFEVRAPERTTEEFLEEAARHDALQTHRARLSQFLVLSDQVKFARFEPDPSAIQGAFDVVKQFLAETTPTEGKTT